GLGRRMNVAHPKAKVPRATRLGVAHDQVQVHLADAIPAPREVEALWARRLHQPQQPAVEFAGAGKVRHVDLHVVDANSMDRVHRPTVYPSHHAGAILLSLLARQAKAMPRPSRAWLQ